MKKDIIRDFVEVLVFLGADYKQRFKKQFVCKIFTIIALIGLTVVFATLSVHYGIPDFRLNDEIDWISVVEQAGVITLIALIAGVLTMFLSGGLILMPPMMMWFYISDKYGSKQHIINVFLFALCVAFMFFSVNLINIFEYLSGETYRNTVNNWGKFTEALFSLIMMFSTVGIFSWLSGISEAWTYAVKEMIDFEKVNSKKTKDSKKRKTAKKLKKHKVKS